MLKRISLYNDDSNETGYTARSVRSGPTNGQFSVFEVIHLEFCFLFNLVIHWFGVGQLSICLLGNSSKQLELYSIQFLRSNKPKLVNSLTKVDVERIINPFKVFITGFTHLIYSDQSTEFWSLNFVFLLEGLALLSWGLAPC